MLILERFALVFFGTPHEGGNKALVKLGSTAAHIAKSLGFRTSESIVEVITNACIFSDTLKQSFRHQLESYSIVSFWEGKGNVSEPCCHVFTFQSFSRLHQKSRLLSACLEIERISFN